MESNSQGRKLTQEEAITELRELVVKARKGDASVVPRLREYLAQAPQLWQQCGDLAIQSQAAWVRLIAGEDKYLQECIVKKANAMKMKLAGEDTPTLEALLVERVVATWLQLYYHETRGAQQEEKSLKWAEFRLKQANAASDRYLKSIGALATLQRLIPTPKSEPQQTKQAIATQPAEPGHDAAETPAEETVPARVNGHNNNRVAALLNSKDVVTVD